MLELPTTPQPADVTASLLDYGMVLRPASGAPALRVNRGGSRYSVQVTMPAMKADVARQFLSRLQSAKREGLRIPYPLLGVSQGSPGSPVVNGTDSAGTTLKLRGLTVGYTVKEGYWLSVTNASGVSFLHNVRATVVVAAGGTVNLTVEPPLRSVFLDGAVVRLAAPVVEGIVTSDVSWSLPSDGIVSGLAFTIEEAA